MQKLNTGIGFLKYVTPEFQVNQLSRRIQVSSCYQDGQRDRLSYCQVRKWQLGRLLQDIGHADDIGLLIHTQKRASITMSPYKWHLRKKKRTRDLE